MRLRIPTATRASAFRVCSECGCRWAHIEDGEPNYMEDGCAYGFGDLCLCHNSRFALILWEGQPKVAA